MTRWISVCTIAIVFGLSAGAAPAGIIVDGSVSPADEWSNTSPGSIVDCNETDITDDAVDLSEVFISADAGHLYFRWDVYAASPPLIKGGGLVEYGFELYLPGNTTILATNNPWSGGTPDATTFFLEDDVQTAASAGTYVVGTGQTVEATVPLAALADLGVTLPPQGMDVEYLAYVIEQTLEMDDETCVGSFTITPEPASLTVLLLGLGMLAGRARRRRTR